MRKPILTMAALIALTATAAAQTYQPSQQRAPAFQNYPTNGSPYTGDPSAPGPGNAAPPGAGG
jgi:hypothetical protein